MHLQPGRLPIGDILTIGWQLLQFSRGGEQCCRRNLTNDKHIEQTVVDACAGSDLDAPASLSPISDDRHQAAASNLAVRQYEASLIMTKIDRQNCPHHRVSGSAKQAFEFR